MATDELGRPVHPEWFTDEFHRIAAWAGHYSAAFTMATYVHTNPEDLAAGRDALAAIYRAEDAR